MGKIVENPQNLSAFTGIYTAPQLESNQKYPPPQNPGGTTPQTNPKNLGVPELHKMTNVLEDGRENG